MKLQKVLKKEMLRLSLLALAVIIIFNGCSVFKPKVVLYPITNQDIFSIEAGSTVKTTTQELTVEKSGWFISDLYLEEVMRSKVNK
jgi:hypothetical protein